MSQVPICPDSPQSLICLTFQVPEQAKEMTAGVVSQDPMPRESIRRGSVEGEEMNDEADEVCFRALRFRICGDLL